MAISEKDYFEALRRADEALRAADQRAIELLARATAARVGTGLLATSIMISIVSIIVAIAAIVADHKL